MEKRQLNNSGSTIAEMLFVSLLVGLISLMVAQTIVFAYRMTIEVDSEAYADDVSEMILDQLQDVISQAKAPGDRKVWFSEDGHMLAFEVANSSPVIIYTSETTVTPVKNAKSFEEEANVLYGDYFSGAGYLNIYYCQLQAVSQVNPAALWTFPEKSYQGFVIRSLTFTPVVHNDRLSVKIDLTLGKEDGSIADLTRSCTVRLYNVDSDTRFVTDTHNGKDFAWNYLQSIW